MNCNLTNTRKRLSRLREQAKAKANQEHESDYAQGYRAGLRDTIDSIALEVDADEALLRKRHADEEGQRRWDEYTARTGAR